MILCGHLRRPKGKVVQTEKNGRSTSVVKPLKALLRTEVKKVDDCDGESSESAAAQLTSGDVLLLENTRFHEGERPKTT